MRFAYRAGFLLVATVLLLSQPAAAAVERMPAASGAGHVWFVVQRKDERAVLAQHAAAMGGPFLSRAMSLSRVPQAMAVAPERTGGGSRVWLVHPPVTGEGIEPRREAFTLLATRDPATGLYRTSPSDRLALIEPLPGDGELAGFVGAALGPVALILPDDDAAGPRGTEVQLLQLRGDRWIQIALPANLLLGQHVHLAVDGAAEQERLVILTSLGQNHALLLQREVGGEWTRASLELPVSRVQSLLNLDGRLVAVLRAAEVDNRFVDLAYLRSSVDRGDGLVPIARVQVGSDPWSVVTMGQGLHLLTQSRISGTVTMQSIDPITGEGNTPMVLRDQPIAAGRVLHMALMLGVAILAILIMLFVKPAPSRELKLPSGTAPLPAMPRLLALLVDLFPGGLAAVLVLKASPAELLRMPIFTDSIEAAMPYLLMTLITLLHCTMTELFRGTTMGKALLGARLMGQGGEPVAARQILLRNLLKMMILLVPPLGFFALLNPYMQGINDLLARTVVVRQIGPAAPSE